jgi:hypothetical protein
MIVYEVTLQVEPALAGQVEAHMRGEHIPAIAAAGCFQQIYFDRASPARFRTRYFAASQSDLDRYLEQHAPRLRAEFQARFPVGVTLTRETWSILQSWA